MSTIARKLLILPAEERSLDLTLPPLPVTRPLLAIGHGTRDETGRACFLDFVETYRQLDPSRPVLSGFLELTAPTIQEAVDECVATGYREISALPVLLFAARHNKFDVTNELDRARERHPGLQFHYGRHFGIAPGILDLWRDRLARADEPAFNPEGIERSQTVLLFVGRGSSDPDANGDACKLARVLWEGSGYLAVETCFIGITHPRLEEGFRNARRYEPKRIVVLPHFLFTGVLVRKIFDLAAIEQERHPEIETFCLPEIGIHSNLLALFREREIETQLGEVRMNCEACKFRLAAARDGDGHHHHHHHSPSPSRSRSRWGSDRSLRPAASLSRSHLAGPLKRLSTLCFKKS